MASTSPEQTRQRTILDVWQYIEPRFGGVGPAAAQLADAVCLAGNWTSRQVAFCNPDEMRFAEGIRPDIVALKISGPRPTADWKLRAALAEAVQTCSLCHVHGLWQPQSLAVQSLAAQHRKPVIASAHGMLETWELAHKPIRKAIYSMIFERRALNRSACLRALSRHEIDDYRNFGLRGPIALIPNGVRPLARDQTEPILSRFPELRSKKLVLFLSRVHEKKGIYNLLRAWPLVVKQAKDAHLLVAGPKHPDAAATIRQITNESSIATSVTFCGTISGPEKLAALSLARCFCLPSYSEGLSIAVLEALSIGLPVAITGACNVDGVAETRAGIVSENDAANLSQSIIELLSLNECEWQSMSNAAQSLAKTRYSWPVIGRNMQSVYEWILGGNKPDHVIT